MEVWRSIDLGVAEPYMAQTFYEAVAKAVDEGLSPNTIIYVQPSSSYVCVGFHQEVEREVNIAYCQSKNLPIIRRTQGGGATYLDSNQIFYQIVARQESEVISLGVERLFGKLLNVTVYVYHKLGLPAEFKAINDIIVKGRKISGNGASQFGENTMILVGNIILDLDYTSMANVLKVPNAKFRDKMAKSMNEWVTSLKRELDYIPAVEEIKTLLSEGYEQILGIKLVKSEATDVERRMWMEEVKPRHLSRDWLYMPELRHKGLIEGRTVKIASDIKVVEADHKARKLIRLRAELRGTQIIDIMISGDFFMVPDQALTKLESGLKGATLTREELLKRIQGFYEQTGVQTPGIMPEDLAEAIMKLKDLV